MSTTLKTANRNSVLVNNTTPPRGAAPRPAPKNLVYQRAYERARDLRRQATQAYERARVAEWTAREAEAEAERQCEMATAREQENERQWARFETQINKWMGENSRGESNE